MAEAIRSGGRIENFAFREPPKAMTRMLAVKGIPGKLGIKPLLMDTGPAAIFGAAQDPRFIDPALIINFGNGHTVAAIVYEERITALFEHHTSELIRRSCRRFASELCNGTLMNSDVFDDGGHGAFIDCVPDRLDPHLSPAREETCSFGRAL